MKKKISSIAISLLLLTACSKKETVATEQENNPDKQANKEYVQTAMQLNSAIALAENFELAKSLEEFLQASEKIDNILSKYPSSDIALKIVSQDNLKIGIFNYTELKTKIIPTFKTLNDTSIKPIARTWAIASLCKESNEAFKALANCLINDKTLSDDTKKLILQKMPIKVQLKKTASSKNAPMQIEASAQEKKKLPQKDIKALLQDAKKDATYCIYGIRFSENLLKKAEYINTKEYPEFSEILKQAFLNASKISIEKTREQTYANIGASAAKSGDVNLALEIISQIKNPDAFEITFENISSVMGKTNNYPMALSIASKIKKLEVKDKFLSSLSKNIAMQNKIKPALEIAKQINDTKTRNSALCSIAIIAYEQKDNNTFIDCISNLDTVNLECVNVFLKYADENLKENQTTSLALATLAKMTISMNAKIAEALNNLSIQSEKTNYATSMAIVSNFIALNKFDDAVIFVENIADESIEKSLLLAKIATMGIEKNKQKSIDLLKMLSNEFSKESIKKRIQYAFLIDISNIPDTHKNYILKPLLKLNN